MNETEKVFYKTILQKIKIKSEITKQELDSWVALHLDKTF